MRDNVRIHPTGDISNKACIGSGTSIWHQCQVREDVQIGQNCIPGKGVYIDFGVHIGDNVKVQNYVSIYHGVEIEDGVFSGPHVCFTNDNIPRAVNPDGSLKAAGDWILGRILVKRGATLGANATILPKVVIGVGAMGKNHAQVYTEIPQTKLVGVADVNPQVGQQIADKYGIPAYVDYQNLLEREKPDVVTVAVPTRYHRTVAETVMAAGVDVLVEKLIAATVEEVQALIDCAQTFGRRLMVGHIVRFSPSVKALKEHLESGQLGKIFQIVCRRVGPFPPRIRDVGVVVDLALHDLDVMRFTTAVLNDAPMPVSGADGLTALRLALAVVESGKTQRVIEVGA